MGYLRERRRDAEALDAMLDEIAGLRTVLTEVVERLDATERRLAVGAPGPLPPLDRGEEKLPTPV